MKKGPFKMIMKEYGRGKNPILRKDVTGDGVYTKKDLLVERGVPGFNKGMDKKSPVEHNAVGMLGGRNTNNATNTVVGGNKPSRGNMFGAFGGAINFPSVTGGGGRNKRRGMGAYNMFKNKIKGIFG